MLFKKNKNKDFRGKARKIAIQLFVNCRASLSAFQSEWSYIFQLSKRGKQNSLSSLLCCCCCCCMFSHFIRNFAFENVASFLVNNLSDYNLILSLNCHLLKHLFCKTCLNNCLETVVFISKCYFYVFSLFLFSKIFFI